MDLKIDYTIIISPNLGYLDAVLPVLYLAKKNDKITSIVFPFEIFRRKMRFSDTVFKILQECNDYYYIFDSRSNSIRKYNNFQRFKWAQKINSLRYYRFLQEQLFSKMKPLIWKKSSDKTPLISVENIVFDISSLKKGYMKNLISIFCDDSHWVSYHHGIEAEHSSQSEVAKYPEFSFFKKRYSKTQIILNSNRELSLWKSRLPKEISSFHVYGVIRHHEAYIKKIQSLYANYPKDHVLVISRPSSNYLSKEDKYNTLLDIKETCKVYNLKKIVIKLHPKETSKKDLDIFYEALGRENYGKFWEFSNLHTYVVAKEALFAIAIWRSNIIFDLNLLKIPIIMRLNLVKLGENDSHKQSIRNIVKSGNAELAQNYEQLNELVRSTLISNEIQTRQHLAYAAYFSESLIQDFFD